MTCLLACGPLAWAQQAADSGESVDPLAAPSECGIRFTPVMARAFARKLTEGLFVRDYELDASKVDQASDLVARRLMQFAHQNEDACQDVIEFFISEQATVMAASNEQNRGGLPLGLLKGIGTRVSPVMPAVRDLTNGVMQDIRPMLGFKQQLRMTGQIAAVNVALDMYEKTMQEWAKGNVDPENPFRIAGEGMEKDERGQTAAVQVARASAEESAKAEMGADWDEYVESAKRYYELDAAQSAAADSLLREAKERARTVVGNRGEWQSKVYRNRFLSEMSEVVLGLGQNPMTVVLDSEYDRMRQPVVAIGRELKRRIEEIPTQAQREAAERRVEAALAEKGLKIDEEPAVPADAPAPTTQPAEPAPAEEEVP